MSCLERRIEELQIIKGIYSVSSGGVTMKNISRWTGKKSSYRSIQRFFASKIDWLALNSLLFQSGYLNQLDLNRYLLALDEVVEDKAGKCTFGINWFDKQYLVQSSLEDGILTKIYQIKGVWTKKMPYLINAVIIIKVDLEMKKAVRVVLFSTDLTLEAVTIIRFYSLRFQIEFNFRDTKQYFGCEPN